MRIGFSQKQKILLQDDNKSIKRKANSWTSPLKPKAPISLKLNKMLKSKI